SGCSYGRGGGLLTRGLPSEGTKRNDLIAPENAEPCQIKGITGPCHRNGAIRTAASLVDLTPGDHLDKKDIAMRRADPCQLSGAIELGVAAFSARGGQREHDAVFGFTSNLCHWARPGPGDCRPRGRRSNGGDGFVSGSATEGVCCAVAGGV